jgi:uncharacterized protein (TIGR02996 family)
MTDDADRDKLACFGEDDLPRYEALAARLTAEAAWSQLEEATRSMLRALSLSPSPTFDGRPRVDVEGALWRRLRDLYRDRLSRPQVALLAARNLTSLQPHDIANRLAEAELCVATDQADGAAAAYEAVVQLDPTHLAALRELLALRARRKEMVSAWCVASVLAYQGHLEESERALYEAYRPTHVPASLGSLDERAWALLAPSGANADVDQIFGSVAAAVFRVSRSQLDREPRFVPPELSSPMFRPAFAWAIDVLGFPAQRHFADLEEPKSASRLLEPGERLDQQHGELTLRELLFVAGRQVAFHRPWNLLLFPYRSMGELTLIFFAAIALVEQDVRGPTDLQEPVEASRRVLVRGMTPDTTAALERSVAAFRGGSARINLKKWRQAQNLSAARAGLLLSGDLAIARARLAAEAPCSDGLTLDEAMKDLSAFATTRAYAALRERIGFGQRVEVTLVAPMRDEFERRIRAAPHDRALRVGYADWLEANGFADRATYLRLLVELTTMIERGAAREALEGRALALATLARGLDPHFAAVVALGAERWGGALAFAPVRLEVKAEAVEHQRNWTFEPQLRSTILVMAHFTTGPDLRYIEDRHHAVSVARDSASPFSFERRLAQAQLRFSIECDGRPLELGVERMSDFDADAVAARLATATSLSGAELERATTAVFREGAFLQAERAWRSLWTLVERTPADVHVAFINCSKEDLIADFEDYTECKKGGLYSSEFRRSGLFTCVNSYNHHGARPYSLLVLDYDLDPTSAIDRTLLAQLGEVGRRSVLPIVAGLVPDAFSGASPPPEHPDHATWRTGHEASYVALCAPSFELRRSPHGILRAPASFLVACLAAQGCSRQLCASPLLGSVPRVALVDAIDPQLARDRGYLAFSATEAGAALAVDTTCRREADGPAGSLSAAFLVTRMCHQALDIDHRAEPERDLGRLTTRFNDRLAARFAHIAGVSVSMSDLEWVGDTHLGATLNLTVPSPVSPLGTPLQTPVLLRMHR